VRAVAAGLLAGLVAGCGADHATKSPTVLVRGGTIFASQCSSCHTLAGRESGAIGGDLVLAHLKEKDVASFARVMPTARPLSQNAAAAVASYVAARAVRAR
jgi:mono/diheme cytochrome c family protein